MRAGLQAEVRRERGDEGADQRARGEQREQDVQRQERRAVGVQRAADDHLPHQP